MTATTSSADLTVYVDTNCFLQLRDLSDVNWRDLVPDVRRVEITVCWAVIRELDNFKDSPNRRRSDRARRALKLINAAGASVNYVTELRVAAPRVTLRVGTAGRLPWEDHPELDQNSPDDQIVLSAKSEAIAGDKLLLSHDHAPLIRGRMLGLPSRKPPEDWLLPRQADERDKQIAKLEQQLAESRAQWPRLQLAVGGDAAATIDWEVLQPSPLDEKLCASLAQIWMEQHPKDALGELPPSVYALPLAHPRFRESQKADYNNAYAAFEQATLAYFERLHRWVASRSRLRQIDLDLHNASNLTAARVLVAIRAPAGVAVYAETPLDLKMGRFEPPRAPRPPEPLDYLGLGAKHDQRVVAPLAQIGPRDPVAFYWQNRPDGKQSTASRLCEEFRALRSFQESVWIGVDDGALGGQLHVEVSATNLPASVVVEKLLKIKVVEAKWTDPRVLALIPACAQELLQA